jgi:hypothetical protein
VLEANRFEVSNDLVRDSIRDKSRHILAGHLNPGNSLVVPDSDVAQAKSAQK